MLFNLVRRNSQRNRKENSLFFASLIVSIVAFYIILSLEEQDVILFLSKIESDALDKLFLLIPVLYAVSLFFLFFLVYFAGKYQLERRHHELGMYLMLGMKRSKLFFMLLAEEVWNSILSLSLGIPIAVFISEMISLVTARIVGLGIIGHHFSFSVSSIIGTILGYSLIRLIALAILSGKFFKKEIKYLLSESQEEKKRKKNQSTAIITLVLGIIVLGKAYTQAIAGGAWQNRIVMGFTVTMGLCGIFLLFRGMGVLFEMLVSRQKNQNGLGVFTFRQIQETIFLKPNVLTISSLLVMMALCCFGYGISVGVGFNSKENHLIDYTFRGEEQVIKTELKKIEADEYIQSLFEMKMSSYISSQDANSFSAEKLISAVDKQKNVPDKEILSNNLQCFDSPYLIPVSCYNELLEISGKETIELSEYQVGLYNDLDCSFGESSTILRNALKENVYVEMNHKQYELLDELYQDNLVTDRFITIQYALIVSDEVYNRFVDKSNDTAYWNAVLKKDFVKEKGLMQAIMKMNTFLDTTELQYESYLQNMGRSLFYTVAATYTTIYLALIFLIIANTVIGVQFLMQQQRTKKRYQTLVNLGVELSILCKSARQQISWYFSLPILVGTVGSLFGVRSLFTGLMTISMRSKVNSLMISASAMIILLCVVEFCYMIAVKRISDKNIQQLMHIKRQDN